MGNRAVITIEPRNKANKIDNQVGIYLHWNGGRDSIEGFLKYCELRGFRSPETDSYGMARLTQVIANFIGGDLSIGIGVCKNLDCNNFDNGVYLVKNWKIASRMYFEGQEQAEYSLIEMVMEIDQAQPEGERLGNEAIRKALTI